MSEAFDTYDRYRSGAISRFPHRFWAPPEGFARVIEIVRKLSAEEGIHPNDLTVARIKEWGLYSPFINLFEGKLSQLRQLAAEGIAAPPSAKAQTANVKNRPRLTNATMSQVWTRDAENASTAAPLTIWNSITSFRSPREVHQQLKTFEYSVGCVTVNGVQPSESGRVLRAQSWTRRPGAVGCRPSNVA